MRVRWPSELVVRRLNPRFGHHSRDIGLLNAFQPRELGDGGRGWPMARRSLHLSMFVQGDHLYDERDVCNIRVLVADDHRVESNVVEVDRHVKANGQWWLTPSAAWIARGISKEKSRWTITGNSSTRLTSMPSVNARP